MAKNACQPPDFWVFSPAKLGTLGKYMKAEIHPQYEEVVVTCSCGNTFTTRSTIGRKDLHLEICSKCHPFYTGQQKLVDTSGRVEKFKQKYAKKAKSE